MSQSLLPPETTTPVGLPLCLTKASPQRNLLDAGNYSPSREPTAITVGASTIADARAYFSNYGAVVDVWGTLSLFMISLTDTTISSWYE